jgi:hypothetical protein
MKEPAIVAPVLGFGARVVAACRTRAAVPREAHLSRTTGMDGSSDKAW